MDDMHIKPMTPEEVHDLLTATLHGPLPQETMNRIFATLAAWMPKPEVTFSEVTRLPDGSAFCAASFPLPKDHWLYEKKDNIPPMTYRAGTESPNRKMWEDRIREATKYAVRACTMNGQEMDFDPDAMIQNMIVGVLGYYTPTGLSECSDENPAEEFEAEEKPPIIEMIGVCFCGLIGYGFGKNPGEGIKCPHHGGPRVEIFPDGDKVCAVVEGFTDLQECTAGFGDTGKEALEDLQRRLQEKCCNPA